MNTRTVRSFSSVLVTAYACCGGFARADEPKPKPENTIGIRLAEPVPAQKFANPPKIWITDVTDRSGKPQPMVVLKERGGIFLDRQPTAIVKESLEQSLKAANMLAADSSAADLLVRVYVFQFGLAEGSQLDFFGKVEFTAMLKNPKTSEAVEVRAAGTSIAGGAFHKKNLQKNVQDDIVAALKDAIRNFLRGQQLKDAVTALQKDTAPAAAPEAKPQR
jgi:hypothetical protein